MRSVPPFSLTIEVFPLERETTSCMLTAFFIHHFPRSLYRQGARNPSLLSLILRVPHLILIFTHDGKDLAVRTGKDTFVDRVWVVSICIAIIYSTHDTCAISVYFYLLFWYFWYLYIGSPANIIDVRSTTIMNHHLLIMSSHSYTMLIDHSLLYPLSQNLQLHRICSKRDPSQQTLQRTHGGVCCAGLGWGGSFSRARSRRMILRPIARGPLAIRRHAPSRAGAKQSAETGMHQRPEGHNVRRAYLETKQIPTAMSS